MNIKTYNKALAEQAKKGLNFAFTKDPDPSDEEIFYCNDTDSVKYRISAKLHVITLYFFAADLKTVWAYSGEHFTNKYYKQDMKIQLTNIASQTAIEIKIDDSALTSLNQNFVAKEETGIITGKKKFDALFQFLSKKLASVKRHFFASPFEIFLQAAASNFNKKQTKKVPNLAFNMRADGQERVWIAFDKSQFSVYYGISFEDRAEQQLCKIFFSELLDSKKHVQNPPAMSFSDSEVKFLIESFPEERNKKYGFTNGIFCLTIFGQLVRKPESMATYLASFRNYVYYHIQAQKCYLHSRVLRKIQTIHKDLNHTKIQPFANN